jgi:uncharacterized protein
VLSIPRPRKISRRRETIGRTPYVDQLTSNGQWQKLCHTFYVSNALQDQQVKELIETLYEIDYDTAFAAGYHAVVTTECSLREYGACQEREGDAVKIQVRVGPSQIAGQGLFAAQDIPKGTRIIQYIGARIPKEESVERLAQGNMYIFAFNERYDIDGKTLKNKARYINHSCDPNCEAIVTKRTIWIVAVRDIKAGEELSYNYGLTAKQYRCHCGSTHCCGYILDPLYW